MPEKKSEYIKGTMKHSGYFPEKIGYNQAIDDIKQNILALTKEGKT